VQVGQRQVQRHARLQDVDHDQAQGQRYQRGADEPAHGLAADAANRLGVAHLGDAHHQGGDHQRRDDHLDQTQENVGEDGHAIDEGLGGGGIGAGVLTE
jgi:hypothetical protein